MVSCLWLTVNYCGNAKNRKGYFAGPEFTLLIIFCDLSKRSVATPLKTKTRSVKCPEAFKISESKLISFWKEKNRLADFLSCYELHTLFHYCVFSF